MKYLSYLLSVFSIFLASGVVFFLVFFRPVEPELLPLQLPPLEMSPQIERNGSPVIARINANAAKIRSLTARVDIQISGVPVDLAADLNFEKDRHLRMKTYSRLGMETDVGSNERYIWFWSKRMKPSHLYYCPTENASTSRLRPALNPNWLIQILGVTKIPEYPKYLWKDRYVVLEDIAGLKKMTVIDPKQNQIVGHYLYDHDRMLAGCEIKEFSDNLPKEVHFYWVEENLHVIWRLRYDRINGKIPHSVFDMPKSSHRTDISR
jgi:hypothetical protein